MDIQVRLAMSGAKDTMLAQSVNTHNLANASTPGFRGDLIKFTSDRTMAGEVTQAINAIDLRQGDMQTTGRQLDVAIDGEGWIAIQAPDGSEAYSRRGDLRINGQGQLEDGAGRPIMGNSGPISVPPFSQIEIGSDGTLSILPVGQSANSLATVDRIKLVEADPTALYKGDDGLLRLPATSPPVPSAKVKLVSGSLEGSNVNPIESLVKMIDLARQFEAQVKMMDTAGQNDQSLASVMRIG
ncbi:MAG: flagellar basal body rod protein FlgF [Pseudomonadales bacterium]|nr:flagellar basal body rod protein FlgF [Pseudomonadales bacterium]